MITIVNLTGKEYWNNLKYHSMLDGEHSLLINTNELSNGIYFCTLSTSDGYTETKKLIVIK